MNKQGKAMLIGSGITAAMVALAGSARQLAADYWVRVALDRQVPPYPIQAERRLVAGCTDAQMLQRVHQAGNILAARPHEIVRLVGRDGTLLVGHWFPVKTPGRVIIAMHGWRSSWDNDFGMVADFFRSSGCSVLYAEQRGQGSSGGEYMGFGLTERYDCADWVRWANGKTGGKLPLYLCGISMGASTVLMAAGLALPQNVRGIIADCGYTSPVEIWKHVAKRAGFSYGICGGPVGKMAKKRLNIPMDAASCPAALSNAKIPVLFVHGSDDHFVPVEMTYENFKACAGPKRLFIVPGAEHGMSYLVDQKGYENAVRTFWSEFDGTE